MTAEARRPGRIRQLAIRLLKWALVPAIIWAMIEAGIVSESATEELVQSPGLAVLSLALVFGALNLAVLRWSLLLKAQGLSVTLGRLWSITFIGLFFGAFLPGTLGFDALKLVGIAREPGIARGPAALSVVADRLIGLLALFLLGLVLCVVELPLLSTSAPLMALAGSLAAAALGLVGLLGLAMAWRRSLVSHVSALPWLGQRVGFRRFAQHVADVLETYRGAGGAVVVSLLLAMFGQALIALSIVILVQANGVEAERVLNFGFAAVMSMLANQIPVTPGGLGLGESAFEYISRLGDAGASGTGYGTALFASRVISLAATLPGLGAFLLSGARSQNARVA